MNTSSGSGPTALDEYGDGCPAPQSNSDNAQGNIGIDPSGNLYYADNGDNLVRKLSFSNSFPATTAGSPAAAQNLAFLLETGSTGDTVSSVSPVVVSTQGITTGSDFTDAGGTGDTCSSSTSLKGLSSTSSNTAGTVCIVPVIFKPAAAGARSGAVQITGTISSVPTLLGTVYLSGIGNGASLAIDPGTSSTLGNGSNPAGVATDSAGNVYVSYGFNGTVYRLSNSGGTASGVKIGQNLLDATGVALDGAGNLYVADTEAGEIVEFPGASTSSSVITGTPIVSGLSAPKGVAVDASGNLYIADTGNNRVLLQPAGNGALTVLVSGVTNLLAVAVDASGNVYFVRTTPGEIEKLTMANGVVTQQSTVVQLSGDSPIGVAVDAAGDLYYGDSTMNEIVEIPGSGTTTVVASGSSVVNGIALDPSGNLYVAYGIANGISFYQRTAATLPTIPDGRSGDAILTNIGNTSYSGGISGNSDLTASTDFTFAAGSSNGCNTPTSLTLAAGTNCDLNITANTVAASDLVTFTGGSTLALTSGASEVVSTTTVVSVTNTLPITFGPAITGTVTVTPSTGSVNPTGTVTLLSGSAPVGSCTLASSTGNTSSCSFSLSDLSAGSSTLTASYGGDANDGASSGSTSLNIAQESTTTILALISSASLTEGSTFTGFVQVLPAINWGIAFPSGIVSLYLDGGSTAVTTCTLTGQSSETCTWSLSGVAVGVHSLVAKYPGDINFGASTSLPNPTTYITVTAPPQAPAVATGDTRTVTEPAFPPVCQQLSAALTSVNDDLPTSVDATVTNPDGARIQAALASCSPGSSRPGR